MRKRILNLSFLFIMILLLFNNFELLAAAKNNLIKNKPNVLYKLTGSFTGDAVGTINELVLYDDNSFTIDFNSYTTSGTTILGQYTLFGSDFILAGNGYAIDPNQVASTSSFTIYLGGKLDLNQGSGVGGVFFIFSDWNKTYNCSYILTTKNE
jgi:hypothetical protein